MSTFDNIARVEEQIAAACDKANRPRESVRLMAVSKMHPPAMILEAYAAGIRLFGENRVQEYADKHAALAAGGMFATQSPADVHCIGPVQSNKAARAVQLFDTIDSIDSVRLAERLDQMAERSGKKLPVYVEVKLSPEASKHGVIPGTKEFDEIFERLPEFRHLDTRGLMTIPPYSKNPELARPYFQQLRTLRESLARRYPRITLDELSMGMSHDFSVAIEEGATLVRIGTAIFGARPSA